MRLLHKMHATYPLPAGMYMGFSAGSFEGQVVSWTASLMTRCINEMEKGYNIMA